MAFRRIKKKILNFFHKPKISKKEIDSRVLKGMIGEEETAQELKALSKFKLIRNPIFNAKNGKTCEIDMILLHNTGLYVIENKNYNGDIYGSQKDYKWTQFFGTRKKYQFYNPILQNARHIEVLKEVLNDNRDIYYNVIIFGENADVSQVVKDYFMIVENKKDAAKRMSARMTLDKEQLDDFELKNIYKTLTNAASFDEETKKRHVASIKKYPLSPIGVNPLLVAHERATFQKKGKKIKARLIPSLYTYVT